MKEKVLKEYRDLEQKVGRLKKFIRVDSNKNVVGEKQWKLLHDQYAAMVHYMTILSDRLTDFGIKH